MRRLLVKVAIVDILFLVRLDLISNGEHSKLNERLGTAPCDIGKLRELLESLCPFHE